MIFSPNPTISTSYGTCLIVIYQYDIDLLPLYNVNKKISAGDSDSRLKIPIMKTDNLFNVVLLIASFAGRAMGRLASLP